VGELTDTLRESANESRKQIADGDEIKDDSRRKRPKRVHPQKFVAESINNLANVLMSDSGTAGKLTRAIKIFEDEFLYIRKKNPVPTYIIRHFYKKWTKSERDTKCFCTISEKA
jgi:hypothetical protein